MSFENATLTSIINEIKKANQIAIYPHVNADGDALGSCIGLALALKSLGKNIDIYIEEEVPYYYAFLTGENIIHIYNGENQVYDLSIAVDTGDIERLGRRADMFNSSPITVNIDHHGTNSEFAFINYVKSEAAASGEIIYELIKIMDVSIHKEIAECLYVAIVTDTGGFRYSNTKANTHKIAAELLNIGVDVAKVSKKIFETTTLEKLKLMSLAINSLEVFLGGKVATLSINDEMLKDAGAKDEDTDGLINLGRNIKGVEVAVMFKKKTDGEYKVNFRSNNYVDVAQIASFYKGGGHKRAAGCTVNGEFKNIKDMILKDLEEVL